MEVNNQTNSNMPHWLPNGPYVAAYQGIMVQQRPEALGFLVEFINNHGIEQVVEIGTGYGGLARALIDHTSANIFTVDIEEKAEHLRFYSQRLIRVIADCTSPQVNEQIASIVRPGKTLFLIDGGHKIAEFNYFKQLLSSRDYIFVHDFAPKPDDFVYLKDNNLWRWHESNELELNLNGLERLADFEEIWKSYIWGAYQKV